MKKYLVVLAAAVVALASCTNPGSKYTKISFKNTEMTLAVGATASLQVLYEPTTLEAPVCVWASSNEQVVTVDQNGNLQAVAEGEANVAPLSASNVSTTQGISLQEAIDNLAEILN